MNPAPRSIGLMMILYAGILVAFGWDQSGGRPSPLMLAVALSLVAGGALMMLRKPVAFWVAMGAGLFTAVAGIASMKLPQDVGIGVYPILAIVIGLYVCLRTALTRSALHEPPRRRPDDPDPPDEADGRPTA